MNDYLSIKETPTGTIKFWIGFVGGGGEGEGEIDGVGVTERGPKLSVGVCQGNYVILQNIKFIEEISDHRSYEHN